jgi:TorA maturation chaperone TorD
MPRAAGLIEPGSDIAPEDLLRAQCYRLLARFLSSPPTGADLAAGAQLSGDDSDLGRAIAAFAHVCGRSQPATVAEEFQDLFIGLVRGELVPYGSYYLTGFLHERPLARLREHLGRLGIERVEGQAEPEDHAAILCEIMAGLASRRFAAAAGADRELFEQHLAPWIGRFFADLERAEAGDFYRRVGMLGRVFVDIETEALALPS